MSQPTSDAELLRIAIHDALAAARHYGLAGDAVRLAGVLESLQSLAREALPAAQREWEAQRRLEERGPRGRSVLADAYEAWAASHEAGEEPTA